MNKSQVTSKRDALSNLLTELHQLATSLFDNVSAVAEIIAASRDKEDHYKKLEALLEDKSSTLEALDKCNLELQAWLVDNGYANTAISEAISDTADNAQLKVFWEEFQALIRECQLQNSANSTLVHGRLKHTQQTLKILTGSAPSDTPRLCGKRQT